MGAETRRWWPRRSGTARTYYTSLALNVPGTAGLGIGAWILEEVLRRILAPDQEADCVAPVPSPQCFGELDTGFLNDGRRVVTVCDRSSDDANGDTEVDLETHIYDCTWSEDDGAESWVIRGYYLDHDTRTGVQRDREQQTWLYAYDPDCFNYSQRGTREGPIESDRVTTSYSGGPADSIDDVAFQSQLDYPANVSYGDCELAVTEQADDDAYYRRELEVDHVCENCSPASGSYAYNLDQILWDESVTTDNVISGVSVVHGPIGFTVIAPPPPDDEGWYEDIPGHFDRCEDATMNQYDRIQQLYEQLLAGGDPSMCRRPSVDWGDLPGEPPIQGA